MEALMEAHLDLTFGSYINPQYFYSSPTTALYISLEYNIYFLYYILIPHIYKKFPIIKMYIYIPDIIRRHAILSLSDLPKAALEYFYSYLG